MAEVCKKQFISFGWDWLDDEHSFVAPTNFAAVGSLAHTLVRVGTTSRTSGGCYANQNNAANDFFGLTVDLVDVDEIVLRQQLSAQTQLGAGLEIWEYIGEAGGPHEWVVRARGEATGDVTGLTGIVNPARCIPFLTGMRSSLNVAQAQEMTGYLTLDGDGAALRFHRGGAGDGTTTYSYAIVEFIGAAWDVASVVATGLSGASGSVTVPDVGNWSRAFIEPQWAAPNSAANNQLTAVVVPGANTTSVDWRTAASVSGAALALHVARSGLLSVVHGTFTRTSVPAGSWNQALGLTVPSYRCGLIATCTNSDSGTGYVKHAKQCRVYDDAQLRFFGSQAGGNLDVGYQVIDFGLYTPPARRRFMAVAA